MGNDLSTIEKFRCVYCGEKFPIKEKSPDHIPSKSLFPKGKALNNPIKIPSCRTCNQSFSLDEEYFRIFLVNQTVDDSFIASQLFYTKIADSIKRRPQIGHKIMNNMKLVDLYTKSGIYLGKKTAIRFSDEDWKRYHHVLDKYIKGIYYHYQNKRVEDSGFVIRHKMIKHMDLINKDLFKTVKACLDNKTVFIYGYSFVPATGQGIIITTFFEKINFMSFVASPVNFEQFKNKEQLQG
ncbi:HNH endonuclease [Candidatus Roizmanbacteria bacterium]|nr:HNH endonuclease [Candidatus Roizmanbacteria bacterium]